MNFGKFNLAAAVVLFAALGMASVQAAALTAAPPTLAQATAGTVTDQTITISGSPVYQNITVSNVVNGAGLTSANLTTNLNLGTVRLNGVPTGAGTFSFSISATDSVGNTLALKNYTLTVNAALSLQPTTLNGATIGVATNQTITVTAGTTPYTLLTVTNFNSGGTGLPTPVPNLGAGTVSVTGTPTVQGLASFTVSVTDTAGATFTKNYTIAVFKFSPTAFSSVTAIAPAFNQVQTITGGQTPYASVVVSNVTSGTTGLSASNFATDATLGTVTFFSTANFSTTSFPGTLTFNVIVTDANGNSFSTLNNVIVNPHSLLFAPPDINFVSNPGGTAPLAHVIAGSPTTQTINVSGGTPPYTTFMTSNYSFGTTTGIAAGNFAAAQANGAGTITLSGTPTHAGLITFDVTATDSAAVTRTQTYSLTVDLNITPAQLQPVTQGHASVQTITVGGGTANYNFGSLNIVAGSTGLVAGNFTINNAAGTVSLDTTGLSAGTATFTVNATDANGSTLTAPKNYTLTVNAPISFSPAGVALPGADIGVPYFQQINVQNGTTPYNAISPPVITGGSGLTAVVNVANNAITVSGTPTGPMGMATFTINVTDAAGGTGTQNYTIQINPALTIAPSTLLDGDVGVAFNQTVTISNGTTPYNFNGTVASFVAGGTGLSLNANAGTGVVTLSGASPTAGTASFTVTVTDAAGGLLTNSYSVKVNPALTISPAPGALIPADVGLNSNQVITVSNGTKPYNTFNISNFSGGTTGLTQSILATNPSLGKVTLSTTPSAAGLVTFQVNVIDAANGSLLNQAYSLTVNPAVAFNPVSTTLAPSTALFLTTRTVDITGGSSATYTVTNFLAGGTGLTSANVTPASGSVPVTVTLNGTPSAAGTVSFTINVVDLAGFSTSKTYSVLINPKLSVNKTTLVGATAGTATDQTITVSGGTLPYIPANFNVTNFDGGTTGLIASNITTNSVAGTIRLLGIPTSAGTASFTVNVLDTAGATLTQNYTLTVNPALSVLPPTLNGAAVSVVTNQTITVSNGTLPYTNLSVTSVVQTGSDGNPKSVAWASFNKPLDGFGNPIGTITLSGTPDNDGVMSFDVNATDTAGAQLTKHYTLSIFKFTPFTYSPLDVGTTSAAQTVTVTGGFTPYASISADAILPGGTGLGAGNLAIVTGAGTITLSSTPNATGAGTFSFNLTVTDASGAVFIKAVSETVNPKPSITTLTLPNSTYYAPYSQTISATGGTGALVLSQTGTLPPGLSFNAGTGVLSGAPTTLGTYNFTITATDTLGAQGSQAYSVTIGKAHLTVTANNQSKTYDGSVFSPFTAGLSGFVNSETASVVSGNPGFSGAAITAVTAGSYTITPTLGTLTAANYDFPTFVNGTLTINKAHLTVTANAQTKTYDGSVFSPFTATITGFVNSETITVLTGSPLFTGTATTAVNAGSYTITPILGSLTATNYDFPTFVNGTLTITKAHLTVTAVDKSKSYDGTVFSPFTATLSGFVNGETVGTALGLGGSAGFTGTAVGAINAGTYTITPTVNTLVAANYDFPTLVNGTLTINKVNLTVTANAQTKVYNGLVFSPFTATLTGFVNSETTATATSGSAAFTGTATTATNVGSYTITPTLGSLTATNYNFASFVSGTLTITKAHLTVTADNQTKSYNGSIFSPFTATLSGFANGETTASATTGSAAFTGAATTAVNAGSYTITPTIGTLSAGNYDFPTFVNGTLTINKVNLTVTADPKTKTYDASVFPTASFTATITGFVNSETTATATSGSAAFTGAAITAINAGSYTITPTIGTLTATNYTFATFTNGTLTINKAGTTTVVTSSIATTFSSNAQNVTFNSTVTSPAEIVATGTVTFAIFNGATQIGVNTTSTTVVSGSAAVVFSIPAGTAAGTYTIVATYNPGANLLTSSDNTKTLTINPPVVITTASLPDWTVGVPYSPGLTVAATGGTGVKTFTVTALALPAGLSLNANTGAITGTPTTAGPFSVIITATDTVGSLGSKFYSGTINPIVSLGSLSVTAWTINKSGYSGAIAISGGTGAYSGLVATGLPTGLTASLSGSTVTISGTPTVTVSTPNNISISVNDAVGGTVTSSFTLTINPAVSVTTASLPNSTLGVPYNQTVAATGGTGAKAFTVTVGTLPNGLTIASGTGVISGTPTQAGTFNFTITATDTVGAIGTKAFSITINTVLAISTTTLPNLTVNAPYNQTITAVNGTAPRTFAVTAGTLPTGLSLSSGGALTGTPTTANVFSFTVTATDSVSATATQAYTVTVNPPMMVLPVAVNGAAVGVPTNQTITVSLGTTPYTSVTANVTNAGGISGLTLTPQLVGGVPVGTVLLTGTPTSEGVFQFNVNATDTAGATVTKSYALSVFKFLVAGNGTSQYSSLVVGAATNQVLTITGGVTPYSIAVQTVNSGGTGLTAANLAIVAGAGTVTLSGTPTGPGALTFQIVVTDNTGAQFVTANNVTVNPAPTTTTSASTSTTFSTSNQNVTFNATVTSPNLTVSSGTVTFTLFSGATQIGTPATSNTVAGGAASATYVVPGGTPAGTYTIQATYNPGVNFLTSTDSTKTIIINNANSTTVGVNQTAQFSASAQNVTLSATVVSAAGTVAEGTVTFQVKSGATNVGSPVTSSTVSGGTASVSYVLPAATGVATYTIVATYNAGPDYLTSSDSTKTLTVTNASTTTAAANATATYSLSAQNVTLNATVSSVGPVNLGTVTFTITGIAGTATSGVVTNGAASASFSIPAGTATGTYAVLATYNPGTNFLTSSDNTRTLTINTAATTTAAANQTATFSQSAQNVTLNATVTSPAGTVAAGTVTFQVFNGATQVGSNAVSGTVAGGAASATYSLPANTPIGTYSVVATYNPTSNFITSSDNTKTLTVNSAATTTTAVATATTYSLSNQNVTLNATITSAAGAVNVGTVTFNITGTGGSSVISSTVSAGAASAIFVLPGGVAASTYTIQATYNPGPNFLTSSDNTKLLTVNSASTTTTAVAATTTYSLGAQNVTLNASVSSTAGIVNVGTVTFGVTGSGGTSVTSTTVANGVASVTFILPAGVAANTYTIVATYNAGTNFLTSSDNTKLLTVNSAATTTVAIAATSTYSLSSQNVTLNASVTSAAGAVNVGTVTFNVTGTGGSAVTSSTVAAGTASATFVLPGGVAAGTYTIVATYNAGANFLTSLDNTRQLTVNSASTSTVASAAVATFSASAQNVTLNATINSPAGTVNTGTVTFAIFNGATQVGVNAVSGTVTAGAASAVYSLPAGTAAGTYTLRATYNPGASFLTSLDNSQTLTVNPPVSITTTSLVAWTANFPGYSQTVLATGGTGTKTFTVTVGALPNGLALSTAGVISGTPTVAGTFNFTVTATDTLSSIGTKALTITINPAITVSTATLTNWTTNFAGYSQQLATTGGTGAITFSAVSINLPTGLSLSNSGLLSGTPTAAGTYNFIVTATDSVGATGTKNYTVVINPVISVTTASLPPYTSGFAGYNQTVVATGGTGTLTYSVPGASLPPGLALNGAGVLTGTPTANGTFSFTVTATDTVGATGTKSFTIVINPAITVTTAVLKDWTSGLAGYSDTVAAMGGTGSLTFTTINANLPLGLTLSSAGVLSGTPTTAGTYTFVVTATDTVGATSTKSYTVVINDPVSITTLTLPNHTVNQPGYNVQLAASGGTGNLNGTISAGSLPNGLTLTNNGAITGTPTLAGTFNFTLTVNDTVGASAAKAYTIVINPPIVVTTSNLANWTANFAGYSQTVATSGGTGAITFSTVNANLPTGMTFSAAGVLSGTPTTAGTFTFLVTATDTVGATGTKSFTVVINSPISVTTSNLVNWTTGFAGYNQTVAATGGTGTLTFTAPNASLPPGLTLNTAGVLSGTPSAEGAYTFVVTATDTVGATGTKSFTVTVNAVVSFVTNTPLPSWTAGKPGYSQAVSTTGGTGTAVLSAPGSDLPVGLTFSATGLVSGTPTTAGTYTFLVTAIDTVGATSTKSYTLSVNAAIAITTNPALPTGKFNVAYTQVALAATGGTGALTFSASLVPGGLALSPEGILSGTPTVIGSFIIPVTVTDSVGAVTSKNFTINITGDPPVFVSNPVINPSSAVVGQTVSVTVGTVTTDDGNAATITINFGDGIISTGFSATHIYAAPGSYTIVVTATSSSGISKTYSQVLPVGSSLGINPQLGNIIGKSGLPQKLGFAGKFTANFVTPAKSVMTSRLVLINLPPTVTQNNLTGQPGTLTIGTGAKAVAYPFALTVKGNVKNAGNLANIAVSVKDHVAQFTTRANTGAALTDLAISLGVPQTKGNAIVLVPVTIQISNTVFIAARLEMLFVNGSGRAAAGALTK